MTIVAPSAPDAKSQLRKTMGFWDVLLFNIATVLGPRWIAAAGMTTALRRVAMCRRALTKALGQRMFCGLSNTAFNRSVAVA